MRSIHEPTYLTISVKMWSKHSPCINLKSFYLSDTFMKYNYLTLIIEMYHCELITSFNFCRGTKIAVIMASEIVVPVSDDFSSATCIY